MEDKTIDVKQLIMAYNDAIGHVYRQAHSGKHEQDRIDAKEWLNKYGDKRIDYQGK